MWSRPRRRRFFAQLGRSHSPPVFSSRFGQALSGDGERVDNYDTVRRRKDGSLVDISLTVSPLKDEDRRRFQNCKGY